MKHSATLILLLLLTLTISARAQNVSHKEKYDQDFLFTDGLYLTKDDFKQNKPIEKSQINSSIDPNDLTFFEQLTQQKRINIFDKIGNELSIETSDIFGYCSDGTIYINNNGAFARVGIIGSICHFLGSKTVYHTPMMSPYYGYYGFYSPAYHQTSSVEPQQYLLDFETGEIMEYNSSNLETLLMKDPKLHDEFSELSRKKKNAKLFYYMRQYNEKHPLYIPVYE